MRKKWIKKIAAIVVFILTVLILDRMLNSDNVEVTTQMPSATLPIVSSIVDGYKINNMYGYTSKREEAFTKDSITPVTKSREITLAIEDYGAEIDNVSYEVRSTEGERLIERGEVLQLIKSEEELRFTIQLKDLIDENKEYLFVTILTLNDGRKVHYYTRFIENEAFFTKEKLDYVFYFHETTLGKGNGEELKTYLESNSKGDNSTFHKVNINSSLSQVIWDGLNVRRINEADVYLKDIDRDTASLILKYVVSLGNVGEERYAFVEEYYRVRYGTTRMYLLNYERTTEEIFTGRKDEFNADKIILGINDENIIMEESEGGSDLAFINGSRLFAYSTVENKLVEVFSFYNKDNFDDRCINRDFKIDILDIEDSGNITFAISGYMNRGKHEGQVGVMVYYYLSHQNSIEEQVFIPYDKSADILIRELDKLLYTSLEHHLFFILEGALYNVDIQERTYTTVHNDMDRENYKISKSGRMIALGNGDRDTPSDKVIWYNLSDGTSLEIKSAYDENIKVLGYMEEDLVYGVAKKENIKKLENGTLLFPIYKIIIVNEEGTVLKEYYKEGYYVTGITIEGNQISLKRVQQDDKGDYKEAADDHIASNDVVRKNVNVAGTVVQDKYKKVSQIIMKHTVDTGSMKKMSPKEVIYEGERELILAYGKEPRFYSYGPHGVEIVTASASEAINLAVAIAGSVVDEHGDYMWKKETDYTKNQIMAITGNKKEEERGGLAVCLDTILEFEGISRKTQSDLDQGKDVISILQQHLRDKKILNLKGCSMEALLYYLDKDTPVLAFAGEEVYLLVGFNSQNIVLMDPDTGTVYKKGMNDTRAMFEEYGNQFITYIR